MFQHKHDQFKAPRGRSIASLAETLVAFSYALDLTEGQPEGHSIRACWIGTKLALAIGLPEEQVWDVYYAVLLKDLGCSSNAARIAEIYLADDRGFKRDFKLVDGSLAQTLKFIFSRTGRGKGWRRRAAAIKNILRNGSQIARDLIETRCTRGADIARQLRFSENVANAIAHLDEHWDGSGKPWGIAGHQIPLASRIALLAQVADVYFMATGPEAARQEIASRSGSWIDPTLCEAFLAISSRRDFWTTLASDKIDGNVLALEPHSGLVHVDEDYLDDIVAAFGQVIDAKSPYTGGHSDRVGYYCDLVSEQMGYTPSRRRTIRRAAMLHDVGKLGVSSTILEKPDKLDADEWHVMQGHAEQTTRILERISVFSDMAPIAGAHHERLDGKGYPLGLDSRSISMDTRIITVCDFFDALTADRPYRAALSVEKALEVMSGEVNVAIDPACFAGLKAVVANGIPTRLPDISHLSERPRLTQ